MLKTKLIDKLTQKLPQGNVLAITEAVNAIIECITDALSKECRIELRNFGTFSIHHIAPRKARNPKTGSTLITPSKLRAHFKPAKQLRDRINKL